MRMEISDYIEKHLNENIGETEKKEFENKLTSDPDFAKKVKEDVLVMNAFDEIKAGELMEKMKEIDSEVDLENSGQSKFHPMLKWAAIFGFLMMLSTWFFFNRTHSSQDLFLAYYTTYPNVENPVVRSDANQQGAWRLYSNGNYEDAYLQFQYSLRNGNPNEAGWFYLGICAIELDRFNQAEMAFNKVLSAEDGRYKEQAQWYLALSYLREDKLTEAKNKLLEIEKSTSTYAPKSSELLSKLII